MPRGRKKVQSKSHPKKLVNHFVICLDRSGSMQPIQRQVVDNFNTNVRSIRDGANTSGQESTVTLVTFGGDIRQPFFCEPVDSLRPMEYRDYNPDGQTPLFDAVGQVIDKLNARRDADQENISFVVIVLTDGEENSSREYNTPEKLIKRLAAMQKTDRWSFVFLLPPGKQYEFCHRFGIPDGNVREWERSAAGMRDVERVMTSGISSYYSSRNAGMRSVSGFFKTDMTNVRPADVKRKLTDIKDKVHVVEVLNSATIRDFVENELHVTYETGHAFYQLMKDETVQHYKKVILREKGKESVYAGADARDILGLPDNLDVKVRPGDHANWDIFIQSTSVNRRLIQGTKLVYLK